MMKEFKECAFKGNLMDMAVGIIIGGAFGTVVKSLVDDVVMPLVGLMTGGIDFSDRFAVLARPEGQEDVVFTTANAAREAGATVMAWGNFVTAFISFLIVSPVPVSRPQKFSRDSCGRSEKGDPLRPLASSLPPLRARARRETLGGRREAGGGRREAGGVAR